jgi:hypothetical protein
MRELPDEPLHAEVTDEEAWAYERMVERILREEMVGRRVRAPRTILSVSVRGHYPSAQIVVGFREDDGAEGEGEWELWDEGDLIGGCWEAPSWMARNILSSWPRPDVERITRPTPQSTEDDAT